MKYLIWIPYIGIILSWIHILSGNSKPNFIIDNIYDVYAGIQVLTIIIILVCLI